MRSSVSARGRSFTCGAVCGGAAAMAASACTHPLDLFKVRLQLSGELDATNRHVNLVRTFTRMIETEGWRGFYRGMSASMLRQALYSPARFGLYQTLLNTRIFMPSQWSSSTHSSYIPTPPSMFEKLAYSVMSGAFGGLLSSPADLVMVRMQADGRLAQSAQRRYTGVIGGLIAVVQESGWCGLWRGAAPNIQRAMVTTMTQFTSYDYFKTACAHYLRLSDGILLHFTASLLAGVVVATCASPMDVIRTRMMNSSKAAAEAIQLHSASTPPFSSSPTRPISHISSAPTSPPVSSAPTVAYARAYTSTLDCVVQTFRHESIFGFYKGFFPYYLRVAPQVTLMFIFYEHFQNIYDKILP